MQRTHFVACVPVLCAMTIDWIQWHLLFCPSWRGILLLLLSWRALPFFPCEGLFGSCSWSDGRSKVRDVCVQIVKHWHLLNWALQINWIMASRTTYICLFDMFLTLSCSDLYKNFICLEDVLYQTGKKEWSLSKCFCFIPCHKHCHSSQGTLTQDSAKQQSQPSSYTF